MNNDLTLLNTLYDKYSPMLYGIALELSPTVQYADELLIRTFEKAHKQQIVTETSATKCVTLIKLILQTSYEVLPETHLKKSLSLKLFQNTPLLHHLLCKQADLLSYCEANNTSKVMAAQQIRSELNLITKNV